MKEIVNVTTTDEQPIEGQEYYYLDEKGISEGTAVKCDQCGKWCTSNSVGIISFNKPMTSIIVHSLITTDELGYDEETDQCLCSDCSKY